MKRRSPRFLLVAALLAACAGPRIPLEVDVKEFPTDVILGAQLAVAPPPPPAVNPIPLTPLIGPPPVAVVPGLTARPPNPCPSAHPFDAPKVEVGNRAQAPPPPASYMYRNNGDFEAPGATPPKGRLPDAVTRSIKDQTKETSQYFFTAVDDFGPIKTETRYQVITESAIPAQQGIYIVSIQNLLINGSTDRFAPNPAIKIFEFPAQNGTSWRSTGTDPTTGISWTVQARVGVKIPDGDDIDTLPDRQDKARVDACGEPIDAWYVTIGGPGQDPNDPDEPDPAGALISGPDRQLRFKALYAIGLQFGGFIVYEKTEMTGILAAMGLRITNEAIINKVPGLPQ